MDSTLAISELLGASPVLLALVPLYVSLRTRLDVIGKRLQDIEDDKIPNLSDRIAGLELARGPVPVEKANP